MENDNFFIKKNENALHITLTNASIYFFYSTLRSYLVYKTGFVKKIVTMKKFVCQLADMQKIKFRRTENLPFKVD